MMLKPVTRVARFVSIDGATIVHISRSRQLLEGHSRPPTVEDLRVVWGICFDESRDSFWEMGSLQETLTFIASQEMVAASARASPKRFAEMVAWAFHLGRVIYPGSIARLVIGDRIADAKRFGTIEATDRELSFYALRPRGMDDEQPTMDDGQQEKPGVYKVCFSLSDFVIQTRELIEEFPKPN